MKKITEWTSQERAEKMTLIEQISAYNRKHFFSDKFINQVTDELRTNLTDGLTELETTNTSSAFIRRWQLLLKNIQIKYHLLPHTM
jgi:hypothetical protein